MVNQAMAREAEDLDQRNWIAPPSASEPSKRVLPKIYYPVANTVTTQIKSTLLDGL